MQRPTPINERPPVTADVLRDALLEVLTALNNAHAGMHMAVDSFDKDPADSDHQKGYLEALKVIDKETLTPVWDLRRTICGVLGLPYSPDPVHQNEDGKWYFWNEVWCDEYGPHDTRTACNEALVEYCKRL